jgi:CRP/FNR family transcriptional regulator
MSQSDNFDITKAIKFLGQTQMFKGLDTEQLQALAEIAQPQTYQKGELIFSQGEPGIGFFIVKTGRVKVFQVSPEGKEQIFKFFGLGEHFAEVPAFDGGCFPVSAAAIQDSQLLLFKRTDFLDLLQTQPKIAINMLAIFARHLRQFSRLINDLSLKEVPARLATYLLNLSENTNPINLLELGMTKAQLAAVLGTIPETLSRAFAKLSQEELIIIENSSIQVLNRDGLKQRAGQ